MTSETLLMDKASPSNMSEISFNAYICTYYVHFELYTCYIHFSLIHASNYVSLYTHCCQSMRNCIVTQRDRPLIAVGRGGLRCHVTYLQTLTSRRFFLTSKIMLVIFMLVRWIKGATLIAIARSTLRVLRDGSQQVKVSQDNPIVFH